MSCPRIQLARRLRIQTRSSAHLKQTSVPVRLHSIGRRDGMANESGIADREGAAPGREPDAAGARPYYQAVGGEEAVFKAAYRQGLALVLKGPTGCGKNRFIGGMA